MNTLVYDSGRQPILVRTIGLAASIPMFAVSIVCLIAIPFPNIPERSIVGCVLGFFLALSLALILGSVWKHAWRIRFIDGKRLNVSFDWMLGTCETNYDVAAIDHFEYSGGRGAITGLTVHVWLVYRQPKPGECFSHTGRLASWSRPVRN